MAGPATSPMAIPGADQYAGADVSANNAYNNALAQINQNRMNTLTQYGYTGTVDPTSGVVGGVRVDPNSIYGSLQQLLHGNAVEDRNAEFGAEDRGLHGGLAHQAASELRYQHGADKTALGNNLQAQLADFQNQQQSAGETRNAALYQSEQAQLDAQMQQQYNDDITTLLNQLGGNGGGGNDSGGGGGGGPDGPLTRTIGGITVPDAAYWQLKGVKPPSSAKQTALKKILGRSIAS